MLIQGYVERVMNKNGIWAVVIDNIRHGFYKDEPKCKDGDYVSFESEQKGDFWNAKSRTLKKVTPPEGAKKSEPTSNTGAVGGTSTKWIPEKDRQDSIIYQSARKDAIEVLGIAATHGLVDFGTGKKADKMEVVFTWLDQLTVRFFTDTKNLTPATVSGTSAEKLEPKRVDKNDSDDFKDDPILPF